MPKNVVGALWHKLEVEFVRLRLGPAMIESPTVAIGVGSASYVDYIGMQINYDPLRDNKIFITWADFFLWMAGTVQCVQ